MPKISELIQNDIARGVAIGVGVAAAGAFLLPAVRPVARAVLKTAILSFEKGREVVAEAGEAFEDIVAEVKAELASERLGVAEPVSEAAAEAVQPE
ncbi:DUF5132 domain-containing protein [Methylolobus aquaticus]|nr:DUF5132 domain-containing protein [Methylolobus aquaticus]